MHSTGGEIHSRRNRENRCNRKFRFSFPEKRINRETKQKFRDFSMKTMATILTGFLFLFASCQQQGYEAETSRADFLLHVKTQPVVRGDIQDTLAIYGEVVLRQEAFLASQFPGRLTGFSLLMGDRVQRGQAVGTIIPATREALLQVSPDVPEELRPFLKEQIRPIPLFSPVDGTVLQVYRHSGDVVERGEHIAHIARLDTLDILGELPVRWLPALRQAGKVRVEFTDYPHPPLQLSLTAISGKVDERNQTVPIRLELKNPAGEFRPGMQVRLTFPSRVHKNALLVPRSALVEEEGVFSVFVLQGSKVEKRQVATGIMKSDWCEVLTGVREGEPVVVNKAYSLQDGMEVIAE